MFRSLIVLVLVLLQAHLRSQENLSKEQLLNKLKTSIADTSRIDIYNELAWPVYSYDVPDSSLYFADKAINLATKINDIKRLSIAHRRIGITYTNIGDIKNGILHQEESYKLSEKINFKRGMQLALNNIGVSYLNNDLLNKALTYFLKSLKIAEELKNISSIPSLYYNIGMIYRRSNDEKRSKSYFRKSKYYAHLNNDTELVIVNNCNLCTAFRNANQLDSARYYLTEAKKLLTDETSTGGKYTYYLNENLLFSWVGKHKKALDGFLSMRKLAPVVTDEITLLINVAEEYGKLNEKDKALHYFDSAYILSKKHKTYNNLEYISYSMAKIYERKSNLSKFKEMIEFHLAYKDSNASYNKAQQIARQQLEFDYERKQVADSIKFEQKDKLKDAELKIAAAKLTEAKSFRTMLLVILIIIVVFSIFISNRFVIINRQNKIIEQQKKLVELKNREILDSINYAKRLQSAILPQISDIKKELDFDILYLPKDIIGGDFYFFGQHKDYILIAVCDCTGHGIPGAMMSVVCHHALQKSIVEFNLSSPDLILEKTRQIVIESLNAKQQNIKDGMDCSFLAIHKKSGKVSWSGANNSLWLINNNELVEIKADKQPVAFYENSKNFTIHNPTVKPGSSLYLFTDGYADQFGGLMGKKYKTKTLKDYLSTINEYSVTKQVELLSQNFSNWKGSHDQVDDVAIAIIKI